MSGKRRSPEHRAIIYGGALNGATLDQINAVLDAGGERPLPETSYREICRAYVPYFRVDPQRLSEAILHPPTRSRIAATL